MRDFPFFRRNGTIERVGKKVCPASSGGQAPTTMGPSRNQVDGGLAAAPELQTAAAAMAALTAMLGM